MLHSVAAIAGGLVVLYLGAEALVRGSSALALRLGITPLVVGLTVVAFGTSSPELVVGVQAALAGNAGIALGNVIGSNICNIALVLGISALVRPLRVHIQLIRLDIPVMIGGSVAVSLLLWFSGGLNRWQGALLAAALCAYVWATVRLARREVDRSVAQEFAGEMPPPSPRPWLDPLLVVVGLGLLVVGADLLVGGAVAVANALGVSEVIIGLTIVALGTSLPELATSIVAALKGEGDILVGNAIGSSIFNLFAILGAAALARPLTGGGITPVDLGVLNLVALLIVPMIRDRMLSRPEGALLVMVYGGYLYYLVA